MTPLCFRCEFRAEFLETGHGPRWECQQSGAVNGCYMYRPVRPVVLARDRGDHRNMAAPWFVSARSHGIRVCDEGKYVIRGVKDGAVIYYEGGESGEDRPPA